MLLLSPYHHRRQNQEIDHLNESLQTILRFRSTKSINLHVRAFPLSEKAGQHRDVSPKLVQPITATFLALLLNECLDSGALFGSKDLHNVRDLRFLSILCLFSFPNYGFC
ncbi:hypothetical protein QYF36_004092 [Acer negundo]|nr:hypothetical protein QYF36_004092 [Acer negundo]